MGNMAAAADGRPCGRCGSFNLATERRRTRWCGSLTAAGFRSLTSRPPTLEELFLRHYEHDGPARGPAADKDGVLALRSGGGGGEVTWLVGAGLAQIPAALVVAGVAAALFGLAPRASVAGSWTALGVAVLMLFLGATLQLSHWILDISPFTHLPKLPGGMVSAAPL